MALDIRWRHWEWAWTSWDSAPLSYAVNIESENYSEHRRTCIEVKLPELNTSKKRDTIKINLQVMQANGISGNVKTIYAKMTNGAPKDQIGNSSYEPQGEILASTNAYFNHGSNGAVREVVLTFDASALSKAAQTVYIYIYAVTPDPISQYVQYKIQSGSAVENTTSDITAVKTGEITTTGQIYLPSDNNVNVSWKIGTAGINNEIDSYTVYLKYGSAPTTSNYDQIKTGVTSTSYIFNISKVSRGTKIFAGIQAIGKNNSYNGDIKTKEIGVINTLPSSPNVQASGTVINSEITSITFSISASDINGQSISFYYSLDGGSKIKCSSSFKINSSAGQGTHSINFYAYDGKEYCASPTSKSFIVSLKPELKNYQITQTYVKDTNGSTNNLVTKSTITYELSNGSAKKALIYMRTGSSNVLSGDGKLVDLGEALYLNLTSRTIVIDINKIPSSILNYGDFFSFKFAISDGSSSSEFSEWLTIGRRAFLPRIPTQLKAVNDAKNTNGTQAKSNYYESSIKITGTNAGKAAGYAAVSSVSIIAIYGNNTENFNFQHNYGTTESQTINLSKVNRNTSVSLKIQVKDMAGQINTSNVFSTFIRNPGITFSGAVSVNLSKLKPLSNNQSFIIAHPHAFSNSSTIGFLYKLEFNSKSNSITVDSIDVSNPAQISTKITSNVINNLAKTLASDLNTSYTANIVITAVDGFGVVASLNKNFIIDFIEKPEFINIANGTGLPRIKHDFDVNNTIVNQSIGEFVFASSSLDLKMFNANEGIIFCLPKVTDKNNDIVEYLLYLQRGDLSSSGIPNVSSTSFESVPWMSISYNDLISSGAMDDNYYFYRYKVPTYIKNQYFYYRVRAKDSKGNFSEYRQCSVPFIICRTVQPNFSAGNVTFNKNNNILNLSYNFKITDLGGSATSSGWNNNFYNQYPNFERAISPLQNQAKAKAVLKIEVAADINFKTGKVTKEISFDTNSGRLMNFSSTQSGNISLSTNVDYQKIFSRFTLIITYGYDSSKSDKRATVVSIPQIFTYFGEMPTVAHRAHHVGINAKNFQEEEVLVIENYSNRKKIVLRGETNNNSNEIIIDLTTGEINGLIINSGTW